MINFEESQLDIVLAGLRSYLTSEELLTEVSYFRISSIKGTCLVRAPINELIKRGYELLYWLNTPLYIHKKCEKIKDMELDYHFLKALFSCWLTYSGHDDSKLFSLTKNNILENKTNIKYETFEEEYLTYINNSIDTHRLKMDKSIAVDISSVYEYMNLHDLTTVSELEDIFFMGDFNTKTSILLGEELMELLAKIPNMKSNTKYVGTISGESEIKADELLFSIFIVTLRIMTKVRGHNDIEGSFKSYYREFNNMSIYNMIK